MLSVLLLIVATILVAQLDAAPHCYSVISSSSSKYGFEVLYRDCSIGDFGDSDIAHASWSDSYDETGWSRLEVRTNGQFEDTLAARAAGFVEGLITAERIYQFAFNTGPATQVPTQVLLDFLQNNTSWMKQNIEAALNLPPGDENRIYWRHVSLIWSQYEGLSDGYASSSYAVSKPLTPLQIYFISLNGDFEDLPGATPQPITGKDKTLKAGHCSALVRLLDNNNDIIITQATWSTVNSMLRVYKLYDFPFSIDDGLGRVPAVRTSFSSYPGSLFSGDDFYLLSSGMVVQETTIGFYNDSLNKFIRPDTVLEWLRNMLANRLATDGASWAQIYTRYNSGTYNNQNMILDYKKFTSGRPLANGTFTLCEQIPGYIRTNDVSSLLESQRYFGSYNVAYDPEIRLLSGADAMEQQFGDFYSFDRAPRAQIFRRDFKNVNSIEDMKKIIRYNDYKHDPLSSQLESCSFLNMTNCTPSFTSENAIATRCDLNPLAGVYAFPALGFRNHVATDAKISSFSSYDPSGLSSVVISGPTYDQQPPFRFSTSHLSDTPHLGMPDEFIFPWIDIKWEQR